MPPSSRLSLVNSIKLLLTEAENLPDDIFEDQLRRQSIQQRIIRLKNDTSTPFERVFGEICFQVQFPCLSFRCKLLMTVLATSKHSSADSFGGEVV